MCAPGYETNTSHQPSTLAVHSPSDSKRQAEVNDDDVLVGPWACEVLPVELLEIVWAQIPLAILGTLNKEFYGIWLSEYLCVQHKTRRNVFDMIKFIKRQVRMSHVYTFSAFIDFKGEAWSKIRPWRCDGFKYSSYLHYIEDICRQANRNEMRMIVRDAIHRHEGQKKPHNKQRNRDRVVVKRNRWNALS
jgi:hypothetical protein